MASVGASVVGLAGIYLVTGRIASNDTSLWAHFLDVLPFLPVGCAVVAAVRPNKDRRRWTVLTIALFINAVAFMFYETAPVTGRPKLSFGVSDIGYLSTYLLLALVAAWPRRASQHLHVMLDGIIAGTACAAVGVAVLEAFMERALGTPLINSVTVAYVAIDAVSLAVIIGVGFQLRSIAGRRSLFLAGFALFTVADVLYALNAVGRLTGVVEMIDVTYLAGITLFAISPWGGDSTVAHRDAHRVSTVQPIAWLPAAGAFVGLAVLVIAALGDQLVLVVGLASWTIVLAILRTLLAVRELQAGVHLRREARTDELTGILNRRAFLEQLAEATGSVRELDDVIAVCLVDLDGFKDVNDTLGHGAGDEVLQEMSTRLSNVANVHSVARLGGDEFAFMVRHRSVEDLSASVEVASQALAEPIVMRGLRLHVESSTGIALCEPGHDVEELMRRADVAMYFAKRQSTRTQVYLPEIDSHDRDRLQLLDELRVGLASDQFDIALQPIVEMGSQRLASVEVLVRWRHPTLGVLRPNSFLKLAEHAGLLDDLTLIVLHKASLLHRQIVELGYNCNLQINIEPSQAVDRKWIGIMHTYLTDLGLDPTVVTFEITESSWASTGHDLLEAANRLRALGYRISVDDFGVGESSLHRLVRLPIDQLKLDRSFVEFVETNERSRAVVRGLVEMAAALDLQLVAEGVESRGVMEELATLGVKFIQGYAVAMPSEPSQLLRWLFEHQIARPPMTAA